jgi:predicted nucleic acid-binding protein
MSIISNTTVLSNFAAIGALDRLRELYGEVYLSTEVYKEIERGLEEGYTFYSGIETILHPVCEDGWLRLTSLADDKEIELFSRMPGRLHAGEASCLAIAQQRGWLLLTDDKAARRHAENRQVVVSGTLGCLILGIERGLWSSEQANGWLERIVTSGFRSPVADLSALVAKTRNDCRALSHLGQEPPAHPPRRQPQRHEHRQRPHSPRKSAGCSSPSGRPASRPGRCRWA